MKLTFVDHDADVAEALRRAFGAFPEVAVVCGDLIAAAENTIVSPANSYGLMDGGIDAVYSAHLPNVQNLVRDAIARRSEGLLPVGAAILVPVRHPRIEYVLAAPTMAVPEPVEALHARRAMRAVLRLAATEPQRVRSIYCPGLCTGVGMVPPNEAADAMAAAYADWKASARA